MAAPPLPPLRLLPVPPQTLAFFQGLAPAAAALAQASVATAVPPFSANASHAQPASEVTAASSDVTATSSDVNTASFDVTAFPTDVTAASSALDCLRLEMRDTHGQRGRLD